MEWPVNQILKARTAMIDDRVNQLQIDVDALKKHRTECDILHDQHKEHKRRSDDAMNNLTESNMMLAKSITDINVTLTKVCAAIERDAPDIELLKNARIAWSVNRWIFATIVALTAGIATIYAFYKGLF